MQKIQTVYFIYSSEEIPYLKRYIKTHSLENVHFLTPLLSTQLLLKKMGLEFGEFNEYCCPGRNFYQTIAIPMQNKTQKLTDLVLEQLKPLVFEGISIFDVLQNQIETEFIDVLYADFIYQQIVKKIKPQHFIITYRPDMKLSGWSADYFSVAAIVGQYLSPHKTSYLEKEKKSTDMKTSSFLSGFPIKNFIKHWPILLVRTKQQLIPLRPQLKLPYDFVLFSAGMNLAYYKDIFSKEALEKYNLNGLIVTGEQIMGEELLVKHENISYVPQSKFFDRSNNNDLEIARNKIKMQFLSLLPLLEGQLKTLTTTPLSRALVEKLRLIFDKFTEKTLIRILVSRKILEETQPKLMITTHDPGPSALPYVYSARQKKIPSLVLLHGLHYIIFKQRYESDYMVAWGKALKNLYIAKAHKPKSQVFAAGFPWLDKKYQKKITIKKEKSNFIRHKKIKIGVLVAFYPPVEALTKFFYELFSAAETHHNEVIFSVRGHPGQAFDGVNEVRNEFKVIVEFNKDQSLEDFVVENDVFLSWDTTAILFPMLTGKPLYLTTPWWGKGHLPVDAFQAAWIPHSAKALIKHILQLHVLPREIKIQREGQKKFLQAMLGGDFSDAAQAHAKLIQRLITQRK